MKEPWCVLLFSICESVFAYSRLWGGWAAEEAETAGWRPPPPASSPSTASWTHPSWLRPLASWMTLGSGSDSSQVGRNGCERPPPSKKSGPVRPPPAGRRRAAVSRELSHCSGCAHTHRHQRGERLNLFPFLTLVSESWLRRVGPWCRALHPRGPVLPVLHLRPLLLLLLGGGGFNADCNVRWSCRQLY